MNIERISGGEYYVKNADKVVHIVKGLNRKWNVSPLEGVTGNAKEVASYSEAKQVAEKMIRRANGESFATAAAVPVKRARVSDGDTLRLELSERLRRMADEVLMN